MGALITGLSFGGIIFPFIFSLIIKHLGWTWTMRLVALTCFILLGISNLCVWGRFCSLKWVFLLSTRCFRDSRFVFATIAIIGMLQMSVRQLETKVMI